jgi:hypothetical protein
VSLGDLLPCCDKCGAAIGDMAKHQQFHDSIGLVVQKALGLTDEEYQRMSGDSPAERDRRLAAAASPESPPS